MYTHLQDLVEERLHAIAQETTAVVFHLVVHFQDLLLVVTHRRRKLESAQKLARNIEVLANGVYFMGKIVQTNDVLLSERLLNSDVIGKGLLASLGLNERSSVHKLYNRLICDISVSNVRIEGLQCSCGKDKIDSKY